MATANPDDVLNDEIRAAHHSAMSRGAPTYRDPATGYDVLTEAELLSRRECCGSGCRHCPYPEDEQPGVASP